MKRPQRAHPAILLALLAFFALVAEGLAQAMLGQPAMAQLLSPSLAALPAALVVLATLLLRLAFVVALPPVVAGYAALAFLRALTPARPRDRATRGSP